MFHTVPVLLQGIVLVSPGIDAERNLMLNILEKLQSIAVMICPNARIVPSPPFEKCTNLPELVHLNSQLQTDRTDTTGRL